MLRSCGGSICQVLSHRILPLFFQTHGTPHTAASLVGISVGPPWRNPPEGRSPVGLRHLSPACWGFPAVYSDLSPLYPWVLLEAHVGLPEASPDSAVTQGLRGSSVAWSPCHKSQPVLLSLPYLHVRPHPLFPIFLSGSWPGTSSSPSSLQSPKSDP